MQSLALTLQAQHGGRIAWRTVLRSLGREIPVGLLLGVACGGVVALAGSTGGLWPLWGPEGFEAREPDELPVVRVKHERRVGRPSRPRFRPPFRPPASACT